MYEVSSLCRKKSHLLNHSIHCIQFCGFRLDRTVLLLLLTFFGRDQILLSCDDLERSAVGGGGTIPGGIFVAVGLLAVPFCCFDSWSAAGVLLILADCCCSAAFRSAAC